MTQRTTSWNAPYTFSGKEKDVETGYGYFGARYYDSGLSIWLSVDPMSDKYPSMSPYNYCANNPVILVDPDGMDIWEVDEVGHLKMTKSQEGNDILISTKTKEQIELSGSGVIKAAYSDTKDANGNITTTTLSGLSMSNENKLFGFLGENTTSEWGRMRKIDENGNQQSIIGSSFNPDGEDFISNKVINEPANSVLKYDHTHSPLLPNSSENPSTSSNSASSAKYSDVDAWAEMIIRHPNINLGINYKGKTTIFIRNGEMPHYLGKHISK